MAIYAAKPLFQRSLRPVERALIARGVGADHLTLAALAVSIAGGAALALSGERPALLWLAIPVALVRTSLNALDGMVARDTGTARPWGEVLNEVGDRLADIALLGGLGLAGYVDGRLAAAALVAALLASHAGVSACAAGGARRFDGLLGKADRMVLLALLAPLTLLGGSPAVTAFFLAVLAGAFITAVQRLMRAHHELGTAR